MDIQVVKDKVYVCGSFDSTDNNLGSGILSYYNNSWQRVAQNILQRNPDYFEVSKIHQAGNEILIAGNFDSIPGERVNGLLLLSNNIWKSIGAGSLKGFQNLSGTSNVFFYGGQDSLYVYNKNKIKPDSIEIGGTIIKKLGIYRNSEFQAIEHPFNYIGALAEYRKQLLVLPTSNLIYIKTISYRDNGIWKNYSIPGSDSFYTTNYLGHLESNNTIFLFFQAPGTGISIYSFDGVEIQLKSRFKLSDKYLNLELSRNDAEAFITGNFGTLTTGNYNDSFQRIVGIRFTSGTMVSGKCYHDLNSDGIYQSGEPLLNGIKVYDNNNTNQTLSNLAGVYTLYSPSGTNISIGAQSENGLSYSGNISISNSKDSIYLVDLPLTSVVQSDLGVYVYSGTGRRAKQGFETSYAIELNNSSDQTRNVMLMVSYDKRIKNLNFKNFTTVSQSQGHFTILKTMEARSKVLLYYSVIYSVDSFILGEQVLTSVMLNLNDDQSINNRDTLIQTIVSAYDPNIKVALPSEVVSNQTTIKYVIYFENLGNDTALNVTVIDTFETLLSLRDVVYGGTTHGNVRPSIENNCLIWHFENIKLPPKSTDSINNKGYVSFRSNLNSQAKKGDTIFNKAAIFFDYQKPVITNRAKVTFVKNSSISSTSKTKGIEFYPNPSSGGIVYKNINDEIAELEFYNDIGQLVHTESIGNNGYIDLSEVLIAGIYTIKVKGSAEAAGKLIISK
ncbi:MAG: T9SS type A sorting domain-containing protein [Chitinophagaceae bacterium]